MKVVRLAEWQKAAVPDWGLEARRAMAEAAAQWQRDHRLPVAPVEWTGIEGHTLQARQWVGVVEVEGHRVEIYPKLDAALLAAKTDIDDDLAGATLRGLLPMLEVASFGRWVEAGQAQLGDAPLSFIDVWAYLLGKHLGRELKRGLANAYVPDSDDLSAVRGRVLVARQVSANFSRFDRIACAWDEFTPDTALNRLLRCACSVLRRLTTHPIARGLLGDCLFSLDDVAEVTPSQALRETQRLVWSRSTQRFEPASQLARRILEQLCPDTGGSGHRSWSFLVDMNAVFEGFCRAVIEARFQTPVTEQVRVGTLLRESPGIEQLADFAWVARGERWIGDAKWKLLGQKAPAFDESGLRPNALSPHDVRQLTVYAELQKQGDARPQLAILYPVLGSGAAPRVFRTWNKTNLHLWPVRVTGWDCLADALVVDRT